MKTTQPASRPPAIGRKAASFIREAEGGAMVIVLSFFLVFISGLGWSMADYAWREAQWEEYEAAQRAAAASAGVLLATDTDAAQEAIAKVLTALVSNVTVGTVNVTSGADFTTIVGFTGGNVSTESIWGTGTSTVNLPDTDFTVRIDRERYETALALDVTGSMGEQLGDVTKIKALQEAVLAVVETSRVVNDVDPGAIMISAVPFASLVNVADTATGAAAADGSPPGRTAAKERYVRLLAGAQHRGSAIAIGSSAVSGTTLFHAKQAADNGYGQWVDTFHRYGDGRDMGPLRSRGLPQDLLENRDWNLRAVGVSLDISSQRPSRPNWVVDDVDFWNGCLMARWGAYWATLDDGPSSRIWPVRMDAPAWSPAGAKLSNAPLHLSDVPPDAAQPHTLFTAYSWPDASISGIPGESSDFKALGGGGPGSADHWLQVVMARMLTPAGENLPETVVENGRRRYNDWTVPPGSVANRTTAFWEGQVENGGDAMCPPSTAAIMPLTDRFDDLADYVERLEVVKGGAQGSQLLTGRNFASGFSFNNGSFATYIPRGVAWALRTISPLWQPVWEIRDESGRDRPVVSCGAGEISGCDTRARKSIILISDGSNFPGWVQPSTTAGKAARGEHGNPLRPKAFVKDDGLPDESKLPGRVCFDRRHDALRNYHKAWAAPDEARFNKVFEDAGVRLHPTTSRFDSNFNDRADRALRAFQIYESPYLAGFGLDDPDDRNVNRHRTRAEALKQFTPWEFFRSSKMGANADTAADAIMKSANLFVDLREDDAKGFGRPVQLGSWCQPQLPFGPYGGLDELVLVGTDGTGNGGLRRPPVAGVAPFALEQPPAVTQSQDRLNQLRNEIKDKLDGWLGDVCELVGRRPGQASDRCADQGEAEADLPPTFQGAPHAAVPVAHCLWLESVPASLSPGMNSGSSLTRASRVLAQLTLRASRQVASTKSKKLGRPNSQGPPALAEGLHFRKLGHLVGRREGFIEKGVDAPGLRLPPDEQRGARPAEPGWKTPWNCPRLAMRASRRWVAGCNAVASMPAKASMGRWYHGR